MGPSRQVIGVDMTHAMLTKARANAERVAIANVESCLGGVLLPIGDTTADVVISNCVITDVTGSAI